MFLNEVNLTDKAGSLTGIAIGFAICSALTALLVSGVTKGRLTLVLPSIKKVVSRFRLNGTDACCRRSVLAAWIVYTLQFFFYLVALGAGLAIIIALAVSENQNVWASISMFQISCGIWMLFTLLCISYACEWTPLYSMQRVLSAVVFIDAAAFVIVQIISQAKLHSDAMLSYRATGAMWITLSFVPLWLLNTQTALAAKVTAADAGASETRQPINAGSDAGAHFVRFLNVDDIPVRLQPITLLGSCASSSSSAPTGDKLGTDTDTAHAHDAQVLSNPSSVPGNKIITPVDTYSEELASPGGLDSEFYTSTTTFTPSGREVQSGLSGVPGNLSVRTHALPLTWWEKLSKCTAKLNWSSETIVQKFGLLVTMWLFSLVPFVIFAVFFSSQNALTNDSAMIASKGAPIAVFCVAVIAEVCGGITLHMSWSTQLSLLVLGRYTFLLAGASFWLMACGWVLLLSSSLQVYIIVLSRFPDPASKASLFMNAMHDLSREKDKLLESVRKDSLATQRLQFVVNTIENPSSTNRSSQERNSEVTEEGIDAAVASSLTLYPDQKAEERGKGKEAIAGAGNVPGAAAGAGAGTTPGSTSGAVAGAVVDTGSFHLHDRCSSSSLFFAQVEMMLSKHDHDKLAIGSGSSDNSSAFYRQLVALGVLQLTLAACVILGYFQPYSLRLDTVFGSEQLAWVCLLWSAWLFCVLFGMLRHVLRSGGFSAGVKSAFTSAPIAIANGAAANPVNADAVVESQTPVGAIDPNSSTSPTSVPASVSGGNKSKWASTKAFFFTCWETCETRSADLCGALSDIVHPNLEGKNYVGGLIVIVWSVLAGFSCFAAYLLNAWVVVPPAIILPFAFYSFVLFVRHWEKAGCPLLTREYFSALRAAYVSASANSTSNVASAASAGDANNAPPADAAAATPASLPTTAPTTAPAATKCQEISLSAARCTCKYLSKCMLCIRIGLAWLCTPNSLQFSFALFASTLGLCAPFAYFSMALDIWLWLATGGVAVLVITYWRAILRFDRAILSLLVVSWIPLVGWAVKRGLRGTGSLAMHHPMIFSFSLFLAATSIQLVILTLIVWRDLLQMFPAKVQTARPTCASAFVEKYCFGCKLRFEPLTQHANFPAMYIQGPLYAASAMACTVAVLTAIYYSIVVGVAIGIALVAAIVYFYQRINGFLRLEFDVQTEVNESSRRLHTILIATLFFCLAAMAGALKQPTRAFMWLSVGWFASACCIFVFGVISCWHTASDGKIVFHRNFFPVYKLDPSSGKLISASVEAAYIPISTFMIGVWGLWAWWIATSSDLGITLVITSSAITALYLKFDKNEFLSSTLVGQIDGEMLIHSLHEAWADIYGGKVAKAATAAAPQGHADTLIPSGDIEAGNDPSVHLSSAVSAGVDASSPTSSQLAQEKEAKDREMLQLRHMNCANFMSVSALIRERDDAIAAMNSLSDRLCVDGLGPWPIWNSFRAWKTKQSLADASWNQLDNHCDELFHAHENCVQLASALNKLESLAKLKTLSMAAAALRLQENSLVSFLRETQPSMASITVEELATLPHSVLADVLDDFKEYSSNMRRAAEQKRLIAINEEKIARSKEAARRRVQERKRQEMQEKLRLQREAEEAAEEVARKAEEVARKAEEAAQEAERVRQEELARQEAQRKALIEAERKKAEEERERRELLELQARMKKMTELEAARAAEAAAAAAKARKEKEDMEALARAQEAARIAAAQEAARIAAAAINPSPSPTPTPKKLSAIAEAVGRKANGAKLVTTYGAVLHDRVEVFLDRVLSSPQLAGKGGKYVDSEFHEAKLVFGEGELLDPEAGWGYGFGLARISDIDESLNDTLDRRLCTSKGKLPSPGDVSQGSLGDCYLLSAASTLAERPELIEAIILHAEPEKGLYVIRLFFNGEFRCIVIDDYFPVLQTSRGETGSKLAFQQFSSPNNLWVCLIEKAYAKLHGSYQQIVGGFEDEAMSDLTGGIPERITELLPANMDANWLRVKTLHEQGHLLGAGSSSGKDTEHTDMGIVKGHAYSILDAKEADGHRLLRVRNPWGNFEWKGRFSDGSSDWTPRLKQLIHYEDSDDGCFWMSFEDFCENFRNIYVCRICTSQSMSDVSGAWSKSKGTAGGANATSHMNPQFALKVSTACTVTVVLSQFEKLNAATGVFSDPEAMGLAAYQPSSGMSRKPSSDGGTALIPEKNTKAFPYSNRICCSPFSYQRDVCIEFPAVSDRFVILLPMMFKNGDEGTFRLRVYTSTGGVTIYLL